MSAMNMARSLLTGAFQSPLDQAMRPRRRSSADGASGKIRGRMPCARRCCPIVFPLGLGSVGHAAGGRPGWEQVKE